MLSKKEAELEDFLSTIQKVNKCSGDTLRVTHGFISVTSLDRRELRWDKVNEGCRTCVIL